MGRGSDLEKRTGRPALTPADPAAQTVESAHQIITMIGANPRAIRPILAQRRLTKEQVLDAATSVRRRAEAILAAMDAADASRRGTDAATGTALPSDAAQAQRTYLSGLRERAATVAEVYQAL